jgi:hypothetical protein
MRAATFPAIAMGLTLPISLLAGPALAAPKDRPVCYQNYNDPYDSTRIVLDVKFHSKITAKQAVYEADGKHALLINNYNRMAVFDGAVVTSSGYGYQPKGAHLGGESYWVRSASDGAPTTPIAWDCSSPGANATPDVWYCSLAGGASGPYTLKRVAYPDQDRLCDTFQDTSTNYPPAK